MSQSIALMTGKWLSGIPADKWPKEPQDLHNYSYRLSKTLTISLYFIFETVIFMNKFSIVSDFEYCVHFILKANMFRIHIIRKTSLDTET